MLLHWVQIRKKHVAFPSDFGNSKDMIFSTRDNQKHAESDVYKIIRQTYIFEKKLYVKDVSRTTILGYRQQKTAFSFIYVKIRYSRGKDCTVMVGFLVCSIFENVPTHCHKNIFLFVNTAVKRLDG